VREALSNGDKILSESYFQHADHFTRILNDQQLNRVENSKNQEPEKKVIEIDNNISNQKK
jgi:hypothetical protein